MRTDTGQDASVADLTVGPAALEREMLRAFGLEIQATFPVAGLPPAIGGPFGAPTRLELVTPAELDRDWLPAGAARVLEEGVEQGSLAARTIDVHPELGYRLYAQHFGLARISPTGSHIVCAPPDTPDWSWQRFLVGRILPWAAVLRGYEAFHASAVAIDGRALAIVGPTGAGKTSLALRLALAGHPFLTDDVLALDSPAASVRAHPGASIASVRPAERAAIPPSLWERLGPELGADEKTYVSLPTVEHPLALGALYYLRLQDGPVIERVAAPNPRLLLASTFVLGVQTPDRLANQLEICAQIAGQVPVFTLRVSAGVDAGRLAEAVSAHFASIG